MLFHDLFKIHHLILDRARVFQQLLVLLGYLFACQLARHVDLLSFSIYSYLYIILVDLQDLLHIAFLVRNILVEETLLACELQETLFHIIVSIANDYDTEIIFIKFLFLVSLIHAERIIVM